MIPFLCGKKWKNPLYQKTKNMLRPRGEPPPPPKPTKILLPLYYGKRCYDLE